MLMVLRRLFRGVCDHLDLQLDRTVLNSLAKLIVFDYTDSVGGLPEN